MHDMATNKVYQRRQNIERRKKILIILDALQFFYIIHLLYFSFFLPFYVFIVSMAMWVIRVENKTCEKDVSKCAFFHSFLFVRRIYSSVLLRARWKWEKNKIKRTMIIINFVCAAHLSIFLFSEYGDKC